MKFSAIVIVCNIVLASSDLGDIFKNRKFPNLEIPPVPPNWKELVGEVENRLVRHKRVRRMIENPLKGIDIDAIKEKVEDYPHAFVLFPGTKWCGPGDVARNNSDLGRLAEEDMCCREHDHCPRSFAKGECKQGLCNKSLFTRSHCHCDMKFRNCLQTINSKSSNAIGRMFFDVNRMDCYTEEPPCSPWEGENETLSDENGKECKLKFIDAGRYHPEDRDPLNIVTDVVNKNKCLVQKMLPGVPNCL